MGPTTESEASKEECGPYNENCNQTSGKHPTTTSTTVKPTTQGSSITSDQTKPASEPPITSGCGEDGSNCNQTSMEKTESTSAIPSEPTTTVSEASSQECDPHDANCNSTIMVDTTTSATTDEETSTGGASS